MVCKPVIAEKVGIELLGDGDHEDVIIPLGEARGKEKGARLLGRGEELQLVRAFSVAGVLDVSMPCDLEVLLEPAVAAQISRHWMIELVAGWIKEPTAVRVWAAECASKKAAAVTGPWLLNALHGMPCTQTRKKHCKPSTDICHACKEQSTTTTTSISGGAKSLKASWSGWKVATCIAGEQAGFCP